MTTKRYSWTQPICAACYDDRYPNRQPSVLTEPELETCVDCGLVTRSGIYLRIDPAEARHPTLVKE